MIVRKSDGNGHIDSQSESQRPGRSRAQVKPGSRVNKSGNHYQRPKRAQVKLGAEGALLPLLAELGAAGWHEPEDPCPAAAPTAVSPLREWSVASAAQYRL